MHNLLQAGFQHESENRPSDFLALWLHGGHCMLACGNDAASLLV